MSTTEPILEARNVTIRFGGLTAVSDVTFTVERGDVFGFLGPNGAGKTTLLWAFQGGSPRSLPQTGFVLRATEHFRRA